MQWPCFYLCLLFYQPSSIVSASGYSLDGCQANMDETLSQIALRNSYRL